MKYKKSILETISAWREFYFQPMRRIKITMMDNISYIGLIEDIKEGTVEEETQSNRTTSYSVPVKFYFRIKNVTDPDNGKQVELDTFSIKEIAWFDKPEIIYLS